MTHASRTVALLACTLAALAPAPGAAAEPDVSLHRNPFQRPAGSVPVGDSLLPGGLMPAGDFALRAVLVAGSKSVVDLGGVILQVGESVNGYTLLHVDEGRAVLRKDDKDIVMHLFDPDGEDGE